MERINNIISNIERGLYWLAIGGKHIGSITLLIMVFLVTADFTARRFFNNPIKGTAEIQELMMVLVVFLGLAYCTLEKRQIVMTLVINHLSKRIREILSIFTSLASFSIIALIAWQMAIRVSQNLFNPYAPITAQFEIPIIPFLIIATIGMVMLSIVLLLSFFRSLAYLVRRKADE